MATTQLHPNNINTMNSNNTAIASTSPAPTPTSSSSGHTPQLCASCDRCRARKTKCDGQRPCGNCVTRYRKVNKCDTLEGIDLSCFECVYSPAKRRGPVPGRNTGKSKSSTASKSKVEPSPNDQFNTVGGFKSGPGGSHGAASPALSLNDGMFSLGLDGNTNFSGQQGLGATQQQFQQQQPNNMMNSAPGQNMNAMMNTMGGDSNTSSTFSADELKQMLALQQQLLVQQQQMQAAQQQVMGVPQQMPQGQDLGMFTQQLQQQMGGGTVTAGLVGSGGLVNNNANFAGTGVGGGGMVDLTGDVGSGMANNFQMQLPTPQQNQQQQQQFFQPQNQQFQQQQQQPSSDTMNQQRSAKRVHHANAGFGTMTTNGLPNSVSSHMPLLQANNPDGTLLRSYYELSTNDVLNLPPIPSDEEYGLRLGIQLNPSVTLPTYDQSALHAARFSELALGALANNQVPLALELSNASVMCLRNCVEEPCHKSCMYDVARAYLLHGIFRSFRGDMVRYFKYRRVCLTHIMQLNTHPGVEALLAAISFHDAWAYLMHNASEDTLPDIDETLPRLNMDENNPTAAAVAAAAETEKAIKIKYGCCTKPSSVATDPLNQMWMQGPPPVFLNNEASLVSRSIDAFACAVRTCCDQANTNFEDIAKASGMDVCIASGSNGNGQSPRFTATTSAVMANENELCSRNIVISAKTLLDQHSSSSNEKIKKYGLAMVAAAMSAFLENSGDPQQNTGGSSSGENGNEEEKGFTESQIKNLLLASDIIIQHPLLLHSPGPLYHMASNTAILLCHLLNGIHAKCNKMNKEIINNGGSPIMPSKEEGMLFDEVLDTFMTLRKLLNIHRKSLPVKLRCHGLPRPTVGPFKKVGTDKPFIELGDTLMCLCRGCQGFVLMGYSPCVAAERLLERAKEHENELVGPELQENSDLMGSGDNMFGGGGPNHWDGGGMNGGFNQHVGNLDDNQMDDDALLEVLTRIIQN